jgi:hypothetical protein
MSLEPRVEESRGEGEKKSGKRRSTHPDTCVLPLLLRQTLRELGILLGYGVHTSLEISEIGGIPLSCLASIGGEPAEREPLNPP